MFHAPRACLMKSSKPPWQAAMAEAAGDFVNCSNCLFALSSNPLQNKRKLAYQVRHVYGNQHQASPECIRSSFQPRCSFIANLPVRWQECPRNSPHPLESEPRFNQSSFFFDSSKMGRGFAIQSESCASKSVLLAKCPIM